jgi:hypothetical protein
MIRALLFRVDEPVQEVSISEDGWQGAREVLGIDILAHLVLEFGPKRDRNIIMLCDDEGLLNGSPPNVLAQGPDYLGAPIHGNALVVAEGRPPEAPLMSLTDAELARWKNLPRFILTGIRRSHEPN